MYPCSSSMSLASLAYVSTRGSWRDVTSFPHIKQDPPDWRVQSEQSPWKQALLGAERAKSLKKSRTLGCREGNILLSGPLNRLNATLSLLLPLDRYRTPSAIGSAIGRPLSCIQTQVGVLNRLVLNHVGGSAAR